MNFLLIKKYQEYVYIQKKCNSEKLDKIKKDLDKCKSYDNNSEECKKYSEYLSKCDKLIKIFNSF